MAGKQHGRKRPGGSAGDQLEHESKMCLGHKEDLIAFLAALECCQYIQRKWFPLLSTGRPYPEFCVQLWDTHHKRDIDIVDRVQCRTMKVIKGLGYLSCEGRLRDWDCLSYNKG